MKFKVGDRVVCGDPKCCGSYHKKGMIGVVKSIDSKVEWGSYVVSDAGGNYCMHCDKCLSHYSKKEIPQVKKKAEKPLSKLMYLQNSLVVFVDDLNAVIDTMQDDPDKYQDGSIDVKITTIRGIITLINSERKRVAKKLQSECA